MKRLVAAVVVVAVLVTIGWLALGRHRAPPLARDGAPLATKLVQPQIVRVDAPLPAHVREQTDVVIDGTVQDITGGPIAGANVQVGAQRAVTDKTGAFSLWMKAGEHIPVVAVADGYATARLEVTVPNTLRILLTPEGTIDGTVTDEQGPVAGALVEADDTGRVEAAISGADGAFHLANLEPGRFVVTARTPHGFGMAPGTIAIALAQRVEKVAIQLHAAVRITGRIAGCKEPTAVLHALGARWGEDDFAIDPDGLLHRDGVRDGRYVVRAECPHLKLQTFPITVAGKDLGPFTWTLQPDDEPVELDDDSATVHGTVTDASGKGISLFVSASGANNSASATSTGAGTYAMKVKPGAYEISIGHDGFHPLAAKKVTLAPHQDLELSFTAPASDGVIKGDVTDAHGAPVADAFVEAWLPTGFDAFRFAYEQHPVVTDKDGAFTLEHLAPGTYNVEADRRGGGTARSDGVALGATVHLVIPTLGSIAGKVSFPDGHAPAWFSITVRDAPRTLYRREELERTNGAFAIHDLPAGTYTLAIVAADGFGTQVETLAAGEARANVAIPLASNVGVHGRLVDETGAPIAGWMLVAQTKRAMLGATLDWNDTSRITDANGAFSIDSPVGPIDLLIQAPGMFDPEHRPCSAKLPLDVSATTDLGTLTIAKPCSVRR